MLMILLVFLVILSVFFHEYGHFRVMRKYGVEIKQIAIGIPVPYLTWTFRHARICSGVPIRFSPLVVMGFVEPADKEAIDRLPPEQRLEISGGGINMNIVFTALTCAVVSLDLLRIVICALVVAIVLRFGKYLSRYLLPLIAVAMFAVLPFFILATAQMVPDAGQRTSARVVEVSKMLESWRDPVYIAGMVSLLLAAANLLPISPCDGGELILVYIGKWFPKKWIDVYRVISAAFLLLALLIATFDTVAAIVRLVSRAFS